LFDDRVTFAWRQPGVAAAGYALQVDDDADFGTPVIDVRTRDAVHTARNRLPPGAYHWRIRTEDAAGTGTWSRTGQFMVGGRPRSRLIRSRDLGVRGLRQNKDTHLLCLACDEHAPKPWDGQHVCAGATACSHCYHYCGRACVAMINRYFRGSMSQDEISLLLFRDKAETGPEGKLGHGRGLNGQQIGEALAAALETHPRIRPVPVDLKTEFGIVRQFIDNGWPMIGAIPGKHVVVIDGYDDFEDDAEDRLHVMQPYTGLQELVGVRETEIAFIWAVPASSKGLAGNPAVTRDSDHDGLRDLDETLRFGTDPGKPDTDGDGLRDLLELRAYRFGKGTRPRFPVRGWGIWANTNYDGDALCDGKEDINCNGDADASECDPFVYEPPLRLTADLAGADNPEGRGPTVRVNGRVVGSFQTTGAVPGYHSRILAFMWTEALRPGETNVLRISVAGYDDVQVRNVRLVDEGAGGAVLLNAPTVYHLGDNTLDRIRRRIEDGTWHDPNGLALWKEVDGMSVAYRFFWKGPADR
jgi:hypothetical protein